MQHAHQRHQIEGPRRQRVSRASAVDGVGEEVELDEAAAPGESRSEPRPGGPQESRARVDADVVERLGAFRKLPREAGREARIAAADVEHP